VAWSKVRTACLTIVAAAVSMACGCPFGHDDEDLSEPFTPRMMVARVWAFAKEHDIVKRAQAGEKAPYSWFDMDKRVCLYGEHEDTDGKLGGDILWRPDNSFKTEERYTLVGFFCFEHKIFYYRFITEDRRTDVVLGPYTVESMGRPFEGR